MGEVLYQTETHTAYVGEREITVIGLKPVFQDEQAEIKNNHQRHVVLPFADVEADRVTVTPLSTNGADTVLIHEVRVY